MPVTVELYFAYSSSHLPDEAELARANVLESLLIEKAGGVGGSEHSGNEVGGGEYVSVWSVERPAVFLRRCLKVLSVENQQATLVAIIPEDGTIEEAVKFQLSDYEAGLEQYRLKQKKRPRRRRPRIGDYYAIPLPDGRWGHGYYIAQELPLGDFFQVLSVITEKPARLEQLVDAAPLFPPVGTAVGICARLGRWEFVGSRLPDAPIPMPLMRGSIRVDEFKIPGEHSDWILWNSREWHRVGKLTPEMRSLEYNTVWNAEQLAKRIMTGENPYAKFY